MRSRLQAVVANNGNRPAIIPSIGVHGHVPGLGTFHFETLKSPLLLNSESATSVLIQIPNDLSRHIDIPNPTDVGSFFVNFVGVYSDRQHYMTQVACAVTFNGSKISRLEYPRYILNLEPVEEQEFLQSAPPKLR